MKRTFAYALAIGMTAGTLLAADQPPAAGNAGETVVSVDKDGKMRAPTLEELQQLAALVNEKAAAEKVVTTHSSGAVSIALDETTDHAFIATYNEEGELVLTCTDDHGAVAAMHAAAAASIKHDTIMRIAPREKRGAEKE